MLIMPYDELSAAIRFARLRYLAAHPPEHLAQTDTRIIASARRVAKEHLQFLRRVAEQRPDALPFKGLEELPADVESAERFQKEVEEAALTALTPALTRIARNYRADASNPIPDAAQRVMSTFDSSRRTLALLDDPNALLTMKPPTTSELGAPTTTDSEVRIPVTPAILAQLESALTGFTTGLVTHHQPATTGALPGREPTNPRPATTGVAPPRHVRRALEREARKAAKRQQRATTAG